jgi:hypothetical protein
MLPIRPWYGRRYWRKADITELTIPVESVENDPKRTSGVVSDRASKVSILAVMMVDPKCGGGK